MDPFNPTAAPPFAHAPQPGRYQVMMYGGAPALEYFFHGSSDRDAKQIANFETNYAYRERFVLRDGAGLVIYDGPALNALGKPMSEPMSFDYSGNLPKPSQVAA